MRARSRLRLAITAGDMNGIGPEVVLKCLSDPRLLRYVEPVIIGSPGVLAEHLSHLRLDDVHLIQVASPDDAVDEGMVAVLDPTPGERHRVVFGSISAEGGRLAMLSVKRAVEGCLDSTFDAMVTAPISKEAMSLAGHQEPGHTEFIAGMTGGEPLMMMVSDRLRVALVTAHVPLRHVPERITADAVFSKLKALSDSLRLDFAIDRPKVAVLGLNPHAGDGGVLGDEEHRILAPTIRASADAGLHAFGPFPADGFFASRAFAEYDAVLAMYHDQGLVPFKAISFESGVNYTAGLPIVRTSPDHGTAYDIAGTGRASAGSMRAALYLALDIARRRIANPHA